MEAGQEEISSNSDQPTEVVVDSMQPSSSANNMIINNASEILQQLLHNGQISRASYDLLLMSQVNNAAITSTSRNRSVSSRKKSAGLVPAHVESPIQELQHGDDQDLGSPKVDDAKTFDWEHDEIDVAPTQSSKIAKSKRGYLSRRWIMSLPLFPQTILMILLGGVAITIPGIISLLLCVQDRGVYWTVQRPTCMGIAGYPTFVFSVYFLILWTFFWGERYVLTILPEVLIRLSDIFLGTSDDGETNAFVEHVMDYLRHMRRAIEFLLLSAVGLTSFTTIFTSNVDTTNYYNWQQVVTLLWSSLLWSCFVWVAERFLLQLFAVQFSQRAYSERIEAEKYAFHVLGCLNRARYRPNNSVGLNVPTDSDISTDSSHSDELETAVTELEKQARKTSSTPQNHWLGLRNRSSYSAGVEKFQKGIEKHAVRLGLNIKNVAGVVVGVETGETAGVLLRSLHDAKMLSKRLFLSLKRGSSGILVPADFRPYFPTQAETMAAFKLLDKDENGDISPQEMRTTIIEIYRERLSLDKSIRDGNQAMHKLDGLLKVFMFALIIFICLGIWGVNITNFLAGLISLWLGILFAIGATIKNLLESVIFLFLTHPYDVGDRVEIDGNTYIVKEFALSVTVFRTPDGKEVIAPNPVLLTKFINNIRRSGPQVETVLLKLSGDTTEAQLQKLKERLGDFAQHSSRDFNSSVTTHIKELNDSNQMTVSVSITHKTNWSNFSNKVARTNRFMLELRRIMMDLNMSIVIVPPPA
ncbi:hypothetical protein SmJEL517_g00849 [Synchytrium microbalum]|uniref:EF-hand domain-containing protein n=1 Tax=Synchytrium microbalum TaxID=1806994 RepID=A0A507CCZ1_9FUNG|nr:uncharacterized protein SmJEL517_g00849 [Synchytrium microbalum]TPX37039.1 hypothetical protein SmJEL517_g00849 [Synchytrium microbalum]